MTHLYLFQAGRDVIVCRGRGPVLKILEVYSLFCYSLCLNLVEKGYCGDGLDYTEYLGVALWQLRQRE